MQLYDVVLWIHITAVIAAFGALFAYPVFLSVNARAPIAERASLHRSQIAFSKGVTGPAIGIVLLAGVYLATDGKLWSEVSARSPFAGEGGVSDALPACAPPTRSTPRTRIDLGWKR